MILKAAALLTVSFLALHGSRAAQEVQYDPIDWPRSSSVGADEFVLFQPQIDEWVDYQTIYARAALSVKLADAEEPIYGSMALTALSKVDFETRAVMIGDRSVGQIHFPNAPESLVPRLTTVVNEALPPSKAVVVPLDLVLANIERGQLETNGIEVNLAPPPIFRSESDAILVMFMGAPKFNAIDSTSLLFAINTNWDLFLDAGTGRYFLRHGTGWLQTTDPLAGPWGPADELPEDLSKLPDDDNWNEVKANIPGVPLESLPTVFTSTRPAELILTDGKPSYSMIPGTKLLYVTNSDSDLFLLSGTAKHFFLTAGRWFRAGSLDGPWLPATKDLPEEFRKIPEDHEKANVLPSVPGTPEAEEAVLQALIPRKVTVDKNSAEVAVVYDGDPSFVVVEDTTVYYAVNSPNDVFRVEDKFYCCYQGVWFVAPTANGAWAVCSEVPAVIYGIPSTHPKHNVTYVYVYESTPSTVVVGYTSGYVGVYPAYGVVMFGLGYWLAYDYYDHYHYHHYHCHPHYYGYGLHASYDHYSGTYYRGAHAYGPYGGAGRGAAYNPTTGTYARGAYAYGPEGSRFAQQAYNPRTGARAARTGGSSPYGSWSRGVVTRGNQWARGGRATDGNRTVGGFETSRGAAGIGVSGPDGNSGAVRTRTGDVYAGKDGNIYKRENGEWKTREGGAWSDVDTSGRSREAGSGPAAARRTAESGEAARRNAESGEAGRRTAGSGEAGRRTAGSGEAGRRSQAKSGSRSSSERQRSLERDSRARSRGNRNSGRFRSSGGTGSRGGRRSGGRRSGGRRG